MNQLKRRPIFIIHHWLGLLLGAQVIIWMASGVVMSWFSLNWVRGETTAQSDIAPPELAPVSYASPGGVIAQVEGATEVRLKTWLNRRVYEVQGYDRTVLFDADTGEKLSPIKEKDARRVARHDYVGPGEIVIIRLMNNPPQEYRGDRPVWRADFDDRDQTRLYISPDTGNVVARRNRIWRIFDFFWMLHIMDYDERQDFNNPLLRAASATGFLFALSGLLLVVMRLRRGGYGMRKSGK